MLIPSSLLFSCRERDFIMEQLTKRRRGRPAGTPNPNAGRPTNADRGVENRQRFSVRFSVGTMETIQRLAEQLGVTQTDVAELGVGQLPPLFEDDIPLTGGGIYVIRNTIDGGFYIGKASDFAGRWSTHRQLLTKGKHHCKRMQEAFNELGDAGWEFTPIERCDSDVMNTRERFWILLSIRVAGTLCYNNGVGGPGKVPLSDEETITARVPMPESMHKHCMAQPGGLSAYIRSLVEADRNAKS